MRVDEQTLSAMDACVVLSTFGREEDAVRVARALLDARLVACVNLLPGTRSLYRWQGAIEDATEVLAVMKTRRERLPELEATFAALHPYQVPEFLVLSVAAGAAPYLAWLATETGRSTGATSG
jgi:periplasmic divalent cation tolerance protein